jgi:hypothetical protein
MRLPPDLLIRGVVRTLLEEVLPEVGPRRARGRLYAAVDVLRNLERRVEPATAPLVAEADSAHEALGRCAAALREVGQPEVAARLEARAASAPAAPPAARADALRETVSEALALLAALEPEAAAAAQAALGAHLAAQAVRELALLQPSMLEEISRG